MKTVILKVGRATGDSLKAGSVMDDPVKVWKRKGWQRCEGNTTKSATALRDERCQDRDGWCQRKDDSWRRCEDERCQERDGWRRYRGEHCWDREHGRQLVALRE